MSQPLTGTAPLVTGASSGIGAATARRLAAEGAAVGLVARRLDRLTDLANEIKQGGGRTHVVQADVTDQQQAISAVEEVAAIEALRPEDIADAVAYIVTRDRRVALNEMLVRAGDQTW